jgi:protein-tyrosine phosphatase
MGNICRSPMAEAVFQDMVNKAGLSEKFSLDSAGTGGWHEGEAAHRGTLDILRKNQIAYNGRARQITPSDFDTFDYIVAMDRENLSGVTRFMNQRDAAAKANTFTRDAKKPEIALFLSYANRAGTVETREVPDPYYDGNFSEVYDLVMRGCAALLAHIRAAHRI